MSLGGVSARFFVGAGAWLLGAAAATGGSLFAVSLLGQGLAPAPSQQLTVAAVNRALASKAAEGARSSSLAGPSASPTPSRHPKARRPASAATPAATPAAASPAPQTTSTVLTSVGGTVVARCETGGAYLVSWSPQQGYQTSHVFRGPTAKAKATFSNSRHLVIMAVTCASGVPSASTTFHRFDE